MKTLPPFRYLTRHDRQAHSSRDLLELAKTVASEIFSNDGEIPPTFLFDNPAGNFTSACQIAWGDNESKKRVAYAMRRALEAMDCERYAVITEVWVTQKKLDKNKNIEEAIEEEAPPSKHPDRQEGVMILVRDRTDMPLSYMFKIIRPTNKEPSLEKYTDSEPTDIVDLTFGKLNVAESYN